MYSNSYGESFRITTFGESHGAAVGVIIDGCPAGLELNEEDIQKELDRRKPGQSKVSTLRKEDDKVETIDTEMALSNAKEKIGTEVKVPKVVE